MSKKKPSGMIGIPPSQRGGRPADIAEHASQVAQEWEDVGERYVRKRMKELDIPESQIGQPTFGGDGRWRAFDPRGREGGANTTGVVVDSGAEPRAIQGREGRPHLSEAIPARPHRRHHRPRVRGAACRGRPRQGAESRREDGFADQRPGEAIEPGEGAVGRIASFQADAFDAAASNSSNRRCQP